jgi:DNA primase
LDSFYSEKLKRLGKKILTVQPGEHGFVTRVTAIMKKEEDQAKIAALAMDDSFSEQNIHSSALSIIQRILRIRKKQDNILTHKIISAEKGSDSELMALLKQKQAEIQQLHEQ